MRSIMGVVVGIIVVMGQVAVAAPADEVTFKTGAKAPASFEEWTFFWQMPAIEAGATLEYVVIRPDGKECFRYKMPKERTEGMDIRSDFSKHGAGGDPSVFFGKDIVIKFIVNKGKIKFSPKTTFNFEFRSTVEAIKQ